LIKAVSLLLVWWKMRPTCWHEIFKRKILWTLLSAGCISAHLTVNSSVINSDP